MAQLFEKKRGADAFVFFVFLVVLKKMLCKLFELSFKMIIFVVKYGRRI